MSVENRQHAAGSSFRLSRLILLGVTYYCAWIFLAFSLTFVSAMTHAPNHSQRELSLLSQAMRDGSPIPNYLATAIFVYFVLNHYFSRNSARVSSKRAGFGSSYLFLFSGTVFLVVLGLFWILDGWAIPRGPGYPNPYVLSSGVLSAAVFLGIVFGIVGRRWKRLGILCLVPPIGCVVGMAILGVHLKRELFPETPLPALWPSPASAALATGAVVTAGAFFFWFERRFCKDLHGTTGFVCAGLWAVGATLGWGIILTVRCGCSIEGSAIIVNSAIGGIVVVLALAVLIRYLIYRRSVTRTDS